MRILIAIPHYYAEPGTSTPDGRWHGSVGQHANQRLLAVSSCIASLHQLYGSSQRMINIATRTALPANQGVAGHIDVVVCTAGSRHLLDRLRLPASSITWKSTDCAGPLLGFECHAVLRDRLGDYDYYGFLEDDLISRDPWLFFKLQWFASQLGDEVLLQPNRYEVGPLGLVHKAYVDGDLAPWVTAPFQDIQISQRVTARLLGQDVRFHRAANPHSGCFFLNARQMEYWARQPYFLDRDVSFVGPLESAATLGIMRTFRVYKPAAESASFLEIEHFGTAFLSMIRPVNAAAATHG
jgi:hypothetical protein